MEETNSALVSRLREILSRNNNFAETMDEYHSIIISSGINASELRQTMARDIEIDSAKTIIEIKQVLGCESV